MASTLCWLSGLFKSSSRALEVDQDIAASRMILEELESRTLFSADPVSGLLNIPELVEQQSFESIPVETVLIDNESQNISITVDVEIRNELIFIDETVTDSDQLISDLISNDSNTKNFTVIVLDSEKNGIDQITETLLNYQGLDAVHIISHGTPGAVTLGNTLLSLSNLNDYSASISKWQDSFDVEADLLIYGCELAGNTAGKALTTELSALTGTDVAASVDNTGYALKGGDWDLEFSSGIIETNIAFSIQVQKSWNGLLAFETYRDEFNRDEFNEFNYANSDGSQDWVGSPWQEIDESDGVNLGQVIVSTELGEEGLVFKQSNNGALREVDLSGAISASLSFEYARISLDDASESVVLEISDDGGTYWNQLDSWQGVNDDTSLIFTNYDISNYIAANTQIRFVSNGFNEVNDKFFVDNFQIAYNNNLSEKSEFLINSPDSNSQETSSQNRGSHQAVAVASNGDYVVVWTEVDSTGDLSDVYAQQYNADGTAKPGGIFQVNSISANDQQWASVATDASGRFVVAWTSQNQDGNGQGVYIKRFNADGTEIDTADILVNSWNTTGNQHSASVALNSQGDMVITWQSDESGNEGVFARTFDMTGATTDNELISTLITVASGANRINPAVDINSEGKFVIVWKQNTDVYAQRFNDDGSLRGAQFKINDNSSQDPVVAIQESGEFLVAYRANGFLIDGIWFRKYSDDGIEIGFPTKVSGSSHTAPSISKDLEGNFIVIYEGNGDGDGQGIFARQYDSSRNALGAAFQINETSSGNQLMASVAMLSQDNYIAVWSGNGVDDTNGVYARQFTAFNNLPTADANAGSPYVITEGASVTLNGSNSSDPDGDTLNFSWDLNNNGVFGDVVGESPTVDWATLQSVGINDDGVYTIGLQVDDGNGGIDTATTTITVDKSPPALITTGSTTVDQGSLYTLNLTAIDSGADTITSWTINWDDGTIDTIAGNPSSVTHTYTNSGFTYNILASAIDEDGTYLQNQLLVADFSNDSIFRFAATTGIFMDEFATGNGINMPIDVKIGPDGLLYVSSEASKDVLRYNAATGAFIDTFVTTGNVEGIAFGTDGNLYVADWGGKVIRYNITDGSYIDDFVTFGLGGLSRAFGITFGPDSNLYVNSYNNNNVLRYDGNTGAFIDEFVSSGAGGLDGPEEMLFGPDGNLYVSSYITNNVLRYDGSTGAFKDIFIAANSGGLDSPAGLAFGPDGNLYVADHKDGAIIRYNGMTGVYIDQYVVAGTGGLAAPVFLEFLPQQRVTVNPSINNIPTTIGLAEVTVGEDATNSVINLFDGFADIEDSDTTLVYTIENNTNTGLFNSTSIDDVAGTLALDYAPNQNGSSDITVRVTDSGGLFVDTTFTVTVNADNDNPTTTGLADITVVEDATDSLIDLFAGFADVEDLDTTLVYTIENNTNTGLFNSTSIDGVAGTLTLDYAPNQNGSSDITVRATDSGSLFVDTTFTVTVNADNDSPTTTGLADITVVEDAANSVIDLFTGFADAEDPDTALTYSLSSNTNAGLFTATTIDGVAGTLTLGYTPSQSGSSNITVRATDSNGLFAETLFTVTVNAANDPPISNGLADITVDEDATDTVINLFAGFADNEDLDAALTYTITNNTNTGLFTSTTIDGVAGTLTFGYTPDQSGSSDITVRATDSNGLFVETIFTVTVNPINDAPTLSSFADIVETTNENVEIEITFSELITQGDVNDIEGDVDGFIVKVVSSGSLRIGADVGSATLWDVITNNLIDTNNHAYWTPDLNDSGTQNAFELVAKDNFNAESSTNIIAQIEVTTINNTPIIDNQTFSIAENGLEGTLVGTVTARDPDLADSLSFSIIAGNNNNAFSINPSTGEITVADSTQLDFENLSNFIVTVQVTDNGVGSLSETASIGINLTDTNESPDSITLTNTHLNENIETSSGYAVGSLNASDADAVDRFTYTISGGADQLSFSIGGIGNDELIINNGVLVFENQSSYEVTVRVTDSDGLSHDETFTVTINQLTNSGDTISQQNGVKTDPNSGLNELVLLESPFEDTVSSYIQAKTDPNLGYLADPISTDINQQQGSEAGDEVEVDIGKTSLLITQFTVPREGIGNVERVAENEFILTKLERHDNQLLNDNKLSIKMRDKANASSSNSLLNSKLTIDSVDEKALNYLFEKTDFIDSLDTLREQVQEDINFNKMVVGSSLSVTTGLSIGYVIWLIRGGVLLSSVLSSLPAWRMIDPLPIMARLNDLTDNDEDDSLESLVKKSKEAAKSNFKLKLTPVSGE